MGWLPSLKRKPIGTERKSTSGRTPRDSAPRSAAATADTVQQARTRARRRLIGAAVLVVAGVIGFPLLFETQPRPVAVDIPIEIPRKEGSPALAMPPVRSPQVAVAPSTEPSKSSAMPSGVITETEADAGRDVPPPAVAPSRPAVVAVAKPTPAASHVASVPPIKPVPSQSRIADAGRAAALLDNKPVATVDTKPDVKPDVTSAKAPPSIAAPASGAARFIVQAGAFIDAASARDTRMKLERLGLKTYTQVADTPAGPRVRVRLGPFASRTDADKALAKAKAAGLAAVVITL